MEEEKIIMDEKDFQSLQLQFSYMENNDNHSHLSPEKYPCILLIDWNCVRLELIDRLLSAIKDKDYKDAMSILNYLRKCVNYDNQINRKYLTQKAMDKIVKKHNVSGKQKETKPKEQKVKTLPVVVTKSRPKVPEKENKEENEEESIVPTEPAKPYEEEE